MCINSHPHANIIFVGFANTTIYKLSTIIISEVSLYKGYMNNF